MLLHDSAMQVILFDAQLLALLMFAATTFLLTAQCCKKKKNKKKKGVTTKSEPAPEAQSPAPPAEEKKSVPAEEGDKKKKGTAKKQKEKGAAEKGKGEGQPAKEPVTATAPTATTAQTMPAATPTTADPMKTMFNEQTMVQLQNAPPGMIAVLLPSTVPGGNPTVVMMPSKEMQSMAAVTAQLSKQAAVASAVKVQSTASKTSQKEPSLYEAIEISKSDGDKDSGKESAKESGKDSDTSKKSKKEMEVDLTKTGMAGPYYGYGTANNVWSPQIGYDNVPLMAHSPVANQFLRDSLLDRENFQSRGCGWDQARGMCSDLLGICKGGCQDFRSRNQFSNFPSLPDCRCVPLGYSFLMGGKQKFN
uniref:ShKT domain-containing protein n=1 Tax=Meloidogyne hapla TaxID=6305 RepID=A0A1I8BE07_MELHA